MRLAIFEKNFLAIWILILLAIALVLLFTFSGCSKREIEKTEPMAITAAATKGSCSDSDGINEKVKGIARGTFANGSTFLLDDECKGFIFLVEYYCEGNIVTSKNFRCNCSKGVCV